MPRVAAGPNLAPTHPPGALGVSAPRPRRWRCRATGSARAMACPFTPTSSTRGPTRRLSCRRRTPRDATAAGLTCRRPSPACGAAQRALLSVGHASTRGCSDRGAASYACRRSERTAARGPCAGRPRPGTPSVCKSGSERFALGGAAGGRAPALPLGTARRAGRAQTVGRWPDCEMCCASAGCTCTLRASTARRTSGRTGSCWATARTAACPRSLRRRTRCARGATW